MRDYVVSRYTGELRQDWDRFVGEAKNSTFLFNRNYMDYHSERFTDHSAHGLFRRQSGRPAAGEPVHTGYYPEPWRANVWRVGATPFGSFGGSPGDFDHVLFYLRAQGISRLLHKQIPSFYNTLPDDDIDYGLFLLEAKVTGVIARRL